MGNFNNALIGLFLTTLTQAQAHLMAAYYRVEYGLMVTAYLIAVPPSHCLSIYRGSACGNNELCVYIFIFANIIPLGHSCGTRWHGCTI